MSDAFEAAIERGKESLAKTEIAIANVLRYGVILCATLIAFGLGARLFHLLPVGERSAAVVAELRAATTADFKGFIPRSLPEFSAGLHALDPDTFMALGLLLLIALPVVRVGMTAVLFVFERDYVYLGITLFVFCILIAGLLLGRFAGA